jgi:hypothetical protein
MRKIIFILVFILSANLILAQTKDREKGHYYAGVGYSLVIFTNSDVSKIYPVINLNTSSFLSEINLNAGYKFNRNVALEFNPSFVFASSNNNKGFNYNDGVNNYYYLPNKANLFTLPLNVKMKLYPFAKPTFSFVNNIFLGIGGGAIFINEQYDNGVYAQETMYQTNPIKFETYSNSFWRYNAVISGGYDYAGTIGLGFEFSYRIVPLAINGPVPVITSIASNFNSVNLSVKASIGFW